MQLGTNLSEKDININTVDKAHLKCNCLYGSIIDGKRESIFFFQS